MISCQVYDYIEIACMHRLRIRLYLLHGEIIEGIALDTARTDANQEAILIERDLDPVKVALSSILILESVTVNPHFSKVDISGV